MLTLSAQKAASAQLHKSCGVHETSPYGLLEQHGTGRVVRMPIKDLAIFNNSNTFQAPESIFGRALGELAEVASHRNVLNPFAEVSDTNARHVAERILKDGKLLYIIEVAKLTNVPRDIEGYRRGSVQIVSGRHRAAALACLYGPDTIIPVLQYTLPWTTALSMAREANNSRKHRPNERVYFKGLEPMLRHGTPEERFVACHRQAKVLTAWLLHENFVAHSGAFYAPDAIEISEVVTSARSTGISLADCHNILQPVMTYCRNHISLEFEEAKSVFDGMLHMLEGFYTKVSSKHPTSKLTGYMCVLAADILKEELRGQKRKRPRNFSPDDWTHFGATAGKKLCGFLSHDYVQAFARGLRTNQLRDLYKDYASGVL